MIITLKGANFSTNNINDLLSNYSIAYNGNGISGTPSLRAKDAEGDLTCTINIADGYTYESLSVSIGGVTITKETDYIVSGTGPVTVIIDGTKINGNIFISVVTSGGVIEPEVKYWTITYNYVDENGNQIADPTTEQVMDGTVKTFLISGAQGIDGYTINSVSPTSATINRNTTVTYNYTANSTGIEEVKSLEDCSWAEVQTVLSNGQVNDSNQWVHNGQVWFNIGDEKAITLTDGTQLTMQIADFSHDVDASGNSVGATFISKELYPESVIVNEANDTDTGGTNNGGWPACELRTKLNNEIFSKFAQEIKNVIIPVVKKSTAGYKQTNIVSSIDHLFIPSEAEVNASAAEPYTNEGTFYPIFADVSYRVKQVAGGSATGNWWTRSPQDSTTTNFKRINTTGSTSSAASNRTGYYTAIAFCVGGNN